MSILFTGAIPAIGATGAIVVTATDLLSYKVQKLTNENHHLTKKNEILLTSVRELKEKILTLENSNNTLENSNKSLLKEIEELKNLNRIAFSGVVAEHWNGVASDYFQELENKPAEELLEYLTDEQPQNQ